MKLFDQVLSFTSPTSDLLDTTIVISEASLKGKSATPSHNSKLNNKGITGYRGKYFSSFRNGFQITTSKTKIIKGTHT